MQPRLTSVSCFVHLWQLLMTNASLRLTVNQVWSSQCLEFTVFYKNACWWQSYPWGLEQRSEIAEWCLIDHFKTHRHSYLLNHPPTNSDIYTHAEETCMLKYTHAHKHDTSRCCFFSVQSSHDSMGGKRHLGTGQKTRTWKCCFRFPSKPMKDLEQINLTNNLKWEARPAALMVEEVGKWIKDWRKLSLWVTETN